MKVPRWRHVQAAGGLVRGWLHTQVLVYRAPPGGEPSGHARIIREADRLEGRSPYDAQTLASHRGKGWTLYGWFLDGVPTSYAWARVAVRHQVTELGIEVDAGLEVGWVVHCETPPAYRGRGYYPLLISEVATMLPTTTVYIYCLVENLASRRGIEKAGFLPAGCLVRRLGVVRNRVAGWTLLR